MYIAVDMGTTNTRIWLCNGSETVAAVRGAFGAGDSRKKGREYLFSSFKSLLEELLLDNNTTSCDIDAIIVSGMAGSELGLCDVAHAALPSSIVDTAENVYRTKINEITDIPFIFVRGLKKTDGEELCDIMRGEETETLGVLEALFANDCILVLPGTHDKIICVDKTGAICDFYTAMSGELIAAVMNGTILSSALSYDFTLSKGELLRGAEYAREYGISAALFHIRVMEKNGADKNAATSFLYGVIIGSELPLIERVAAGRNIYIGGREVLRRAYCMLLEDRACALDSDVADNAVKNGLMKIYEKVKTV